MGLLISWMKEAFPPKSKFSVEDIPDLTGKVIIVTGANAGVGKETAKVLLAHNAKVYLAGRNKEKVEEAITEIAEQTGQQGIYLKLDLSDLKSVKAAAEEFQSKEKDLHVLFNNAGVMAPPIDQLTAQGHDLQFGTNVLGHFYFTQLLLPALLSGAKSSSDGKARVVNISSFASRIPSTLDFNTLKDSPARKKVGTNMMYYQSKLGNVLFSNEFARRYGDQGIVSTSLHPGSIRSNILRHSDFIQTTLLGPFLRTIPEGALTQLWAGTSKEGLELNGKYLIPWARVGVPNPVALDPKLAGVLWKWMEDQVKDI